MAVRPTNSVGSLLRRRRCAPSHLGGGDDRVSGTDADRHDDIFHNGSSEFGGNPDSADTAELVAPCKSLVGVLPHQLAYRPNMTQSELSNLIMKQCSRYGEPSTLRALVPFLLTAAPEAVPFVEAAAEVRDEFYRANGIRPWRRQN